MRISKWNVKKTVKKSVLAVFLGSNLYAASALAGGIPTFDAAGLSNDVTQWIQDTMTELEHHIKDYEMLISQYETMYNQFTYLQNQYKGLVDSFKNIHNFQDMLNTYHHVVDMYNSSVNAYNKFATTTNQNFANLCGKLESKTLDSSACSAEVKAFLAQMNETNEKIRKDNDPTVEGSTANTIKKDADAVKAFADEIASRSETDANKEGQLLTDLRTSSLMLNKSLVQIQQQNQNLLNEMRGVNQRLEQQSSRQLEEDVKRIRPYKNLQEISKQYLMK